MKNNENLWNPNENLTSSRAEVGLILVVLMLALVLVWSRSQFFLWGAPGRSSACGELQAPKKKKKTIKTMKNNENQKKLIKTNEKQ